MQHGIILTAPIDHYSSYGLHAIALARGLTALGIPVHVRPTKQTGTIPPDVLAMIRKADCDVELMLHHPVMVPTPGKKTIYLTMNESTALPADRVAILNHAQEIIVPSKWDAVNFRNCGVTRPINVVPLGVSDAFTTYRSPTDPRPFVFACAGRLRNGVERKGLLRVIQHFIEAFPDHPDVRLRVKCFPDCRVPNYDDPRIEVTRAILREEQMVDWLAACHCFVNLANGGWELFPHQAMAIGRPVISLAFGGMTEYFHHGNGFVVPHQLVEAKEGWVGLWAIEESKTMQETLRDLAAKPELAAAMGHIAHESVKDMTWSKHCAGIETILRGHMLPDVTTFGLITVVIPVCSRDVAWAIRHAEWLAELGTCNPNTAFVVCDETLALSDMERLAETLEKSFADVRILLIPEPPTKGWPAAPNWVFQQVALRMAHGTQPWLFLEPDCTVLRADWLTILEEEYRQAGKPFMGPVVKGMGHMNGVAVYPADLPTRAGRLMGAKNVAFDFVIQDEIKNDVHDASHIMQHIWSVKGGVLSGNRDGTAPQALTEAQVRQWINPAAVMVHRIKDDSLIRHLLAGRASGVTVECVVCNDKHPENIPAIRDRLRKQHWIGLLAEPPTVTLLTSQSEREVDGGGFDRVFRMPTNHSSKLTMALFAEKRYTLLIDDDEMPKPDRIECFIHEHSDH